MFGGDAGRPPSPTVTVRLKRDKSSRKMIHFLSSQTHCMKEMMYLY